VNEHDGSSGKGRGSPDRFLYGFLHYRNMSLVNLVNEEKIHVDTASILLESVLASRAGFASINSQREAT
jgi:hypothetical protein